MLDDRAPLAGIAELSATPTASVPLDDLDLALLRLLAVDARSSQRSLARELGRSAPAIGERIARLERTGVIRGYSVVLDWGAAGLPVLCYLAITAVQGHNLGPVLDEVRQLAEVESVTVVTGELDLLARVRVRDHAHLQRLLLERVWRIDGVQRTVTYLSLAEAPHKTFPIDLLDSMTTRT